MLRSPRDIRDDPDLEGQFILSTKDGRHPQEAAAGMQQACGYLSASRTVVVVLSPFRLLCNSSFAIFAPLCYRLISLARPGQGFKSSIDQDNKYCLWMFLNGHGSEPYHPL